MTRCVRYIPFIISNTRAFTVTRSLATCSVCPKYSEEIKTPYFAHGLDGIISSYAYKTCGIVNGIDYNYYDPSNDPALAAEYSASYRTFAGKAENKKALQELLGLPVKEDTPVVAMITRLASHKGVDLVQCVVEEFVQENVQFVVLGTGEREYEDFFKGLSVKYPEKVAACIQFDKVLSKKIYAGSDIFLMPSKSEPCGLSQMIASRYGSVPVVRETGGLYDTIKPFNPESREGNGITFVTYNAHDMLDAMRRATALYDKKALWKKLVKNAMTADFTWSASAKKYLELYSSL